MHDCGELTAHELLWYEPESVPFEQVLVSCVQVEPYPTDDDLYAVTDCPLVIALPFQLQDAVVVFVVACPELACDEPACPEEFEGVEFAFVFPSPLI